ncbi:MAG: SLC13 family permease, partial [Gammaproteobacteria bacterium]|nr:SLC13 family permease [Gammaproteobacteria bacterium]
MTNDAIIVFSIIAIAAALMASNRVRFDIVALLVVMALMLSGVLSIGEALAGFGSSVVAMVAGLLVIGEMLARTGVAQAVGDWILKKGGSNETRLLILIMLGAALLGAVMSSTAIVAIFIPIVLRIAAETGHNASRMLIPMSYAALISGMLTLIATTPNIVVHEELKEAGFSGFGFFSFAPVGLAVLVVAIIYILFIGRKMLSGDTDISAADRRGRSIDDLWNEFRLGEEYCNLRIESHSPLAGKSIASSLLESQYRVRILGILRQPSTGEERISAPAPNTELRSEDVLLVVGKQEDLKRLSSEQLLTLETPSKQHRQRWLWEMGAATVLVYPESKLIDKSLREAEFRSNYDVHVFGLRRAKQPVAEFKDVKLRSADSLFVVGPWPKIQQLQQQTHDFVVTELPSEHAEIVPSYRRMPIALIILVSMVLLSIFDIMPLVPAVMLASLAAIFTRCLTMEDAYRAIHWSSLVLVAGMLPLADALDKTGGTQLIVDALMTTAGDSGPYMMLSLIFFLTAGLGLVLSNTASAVLVAPIAIYTASALGVSPYPFAIAVLIAASAAYSTPVSTPVVT